MVCGHELRASETVHKHLKEEKCDQSDFDFDIVDGAMVVGLYTAVVSVLYMWKHLFNDRCQRRMVRLV